ncbi:MAG TPA: FAD-binding oxidoreductase [Candidatus Acidoferrum sp.]|nr:FAD-binding oxidoreductase [Candidatus Acidoferrum sp.]
MKKQMGNWGKAPWKIDFRAKTKRLPQQVDVAILGGGFTGLTAAAMVKRLAPEKSVLLLEAERVGNGASGRTGGMVLAETAAGDLPGLGDVLKGYREILRQLSVKANLTLPGVWEVARGARSMDGKRVHAMKGSPIEWDDLGTVRAVAKVAGGSVDPGKVVAGLARAAEKAGAQIVERAALERMEFGEKVRLHVRPGGKAGARRIVISAERVLLATNAGSVELGEKLFGGREPAEPKLTFAIATARISKKQIAAIGLGSGRPFYTVDFPYLWGRQTPDGRLIFGSGLVPGFGESLRAESKKRKATEFDARKLWKGLEKVDVRKGEAMGRLESLEKRVRGLHPALEKIRVTHRWGGPILLTKEFLPVFRKHPGSERVIVAGGYSGHGVALSVYLGRWAAEHLLGRRKLPNWPRA